MRWDPHFKHVFMEVPQPKKSKVKLVALGAGISRHADWFVTLGDYLALQPPTSGIYKEGSAAWVFPNLQLTGSPGTTMGNYIRALLPLDRGGHIKYQDERIVLHDLPPGANAGGIRPGACNQLVAAVPAEFAVNVTGHDLTKTSAFFEYVDSTRAGCMPGSIVLGGWEPLPHGRLGKGPVPPSLDVLENLAVDMHKVSEAIDYLFTIDSASSPMLKKNGHLRPMVQAAFASLVLYFEERDKAGEAHAVRVQMCEALQAVGLTRDGAAPVVLRQWGVEIRRQFDIDNLALKVRSESPDLIQLVTALQQQLAELTQQRTALNELGRIVSGMHQSIGALTRSSTSHLGAPHRLSTSSCSSPSGEAPSNKASSQPEPQPLLGKELQQPPTARPLLPPQQPPPPNAFASMLVAGQNSNPTVSITGVVAADFFSDCMLKHGGALPLVKSKQESAKANLCLKVFNAIATAEELDLLKPQAASTPPRDPGERRALVARLNELVVVRLMDGYLRAGKKVPKGMEKPGYVLPVSSVATCSDQLGIKMSSFNPASFKEWRANWEALSEDELAHFWKQVRGDGASHGHKKKQAKK